MADDIRAALAAASEAGADARKHGGFAEVNSRLAIKTADEASKLAAIAAAPDSLRLVAGAIAAGEDLLADIAAALDVAATGADLIDQAATLAAGLAPKTKVKAKVAAETLQDARSRFDDAAAFFANADAGSAGTGDLINLLLSTGAVSADEAAKASVQVALDAVITTRRFARAAVSSAVQAREAIDESLQLLGEPLPPPEPVEPSKLNVRAAAPTVREGDPGDPNKAIAFVVTREGPVGQACSVTWTRSGTTRSRDFVTGTESTGTVAWASGDDSVKRIEFLLTPDSTVEADETVIVTLSAPVGAAAELGSAVTAVTTISNDDAVVVEPPPVDPPPVDPPPSGGGGGYDDRLPFGGLGMGTACLLGQPGNQRVTSASSITIRCEKSGYIDRMQWNNRFNGHGRTGYSTGDGGTISWTLRVVADPATGQLRPGPVLGQTARISSPINANSWADEYRAAGGRGSVPSKFAEYPTIRFQKPVRVTRGDMLLLTQRQHGSGSVSINNAYSSCRSLSDWSPYSLHKACRQFKSELSSPRPEHYPMILIGYTDGAVKGTGVMGYSAGLSETQESIVLDGNTRARQVFEVPEWADGKAIKRVISFWGRTTAAVNGSLRCRIRLAQGSGGQDEGQALADSVLLANQVAYRSNIKMGASTPLLRHNFARPAVLRAGQTIYVVMEVVGGSTKYLGNRMVRWLGYAPVGLKEADWALKGMVGQKTTGGGWQDLTVSGVKHDLPLWLEF